MTAPLTIKVSPDDCIPAIDDLQYSLESDHKDARAIEIVMEPGSYRVPITITDDVFQNRDIVLRCRDKDNLPLLNGSPVQISARSVRLQGIVLSGWGSTLPAIWIRAETEVELIDCSFTRNVSSGERRAGMLLDIGALPAEPGLHLLVQDCWFGENAAPAGSHLIAFDTPVGSSFAQVTFENVAFCENDYEAGVVLEATKSLSVANCLIVNGLAKGHGSNYALADTWPETAIEIHDSILVGKDFKSLLSQYNPEYKNPKFPPARIAKSHIYLVHEQPKTAPPHALHLTETKVQAATALKPLDEDDLQSLYTLASKGASGAINEMRKRLTPS